MKTTILRGLIFGISSSISILLIGISYAVFINITNVSTDQTLTADLINNIINNQKDLDNRIQSLPIIDSKQLATAWVNFDGTNCNLGILSNECLIINSFNISKIVRNSTGSFDVFFSTNMDNINYSIQASTYEAVHAIGTYSYALNTFKVITRNSTTASLLNSPINNILVFGGKN